MMYFLYERWPTHRKNITATHFVQPQPNIFSWVLISSAVCTAACSLDCNSVACTGTASNTCTQQLGHM